MNADIHILWPLVCLFSQKNTDKQERAMKRFTQTLIKSAISLGGAFYLLYRLHYTKDQLEAAYPEITTRINVKKKYAPPPSY